MNNSQKMQSELFIVLALIFLLVAVQLIPENRKIEGNLYEVKENLNISLDSIYDYKIRLDSLQNIIKIQDLKLDSLEHRANLGIPVFYLSEEDRNFRFSTGSYDLDYYYKIALNKKIKEIDSIASLYPEYNAIEIIGHTDGRPIRKNNRYRNNIDNRSADIAWEFYYNGSYRNFNAIPGSNIDLGILRAMSVATYIKRTSRQDNILRNIEYWFPYSAGSTLRKNGQISTYSQAKNDSRNDDASRRRIEIRLLKYDN